MCAFPHSALQQLRQTITDQFLYRFTRGLSDRPSGHRKRADRHVLFPAPILNCHPALPEFLFIPYPFINVKLMLDLQCIHAAILLSKDPAIAIHFHGTGQHLAGSLSNLFSLVGMHGWFTVYILGMQTGLRKISALLRLKNCF